MRVTCQDLLNQRRPRAGQAEHENGRLRLVSCPRHVLEELGGKCPAHPLKTVQCRALVVDQLLTPQPISLEQAGKGASVVLDIPEGATQREAQRNAGVDRQALTIISESEHCREVAIVCREPFRLGKIVIGGRLKGCRIYCSL